MRETGGGGMGEVGVEKILGVSWNLGEGCFGKVGFSIESLFQGVACCVFFFCRVYIL